MTTKLNPEKLDGGEQNKYRCIAPNHSHWTLNHAATARCEYAPSPQPSAEATPNPNVTKEWIENKQLENGDPNFFRKQILGEWPSEPAPSGETRGTRKHGVDCKKEPHVGGGYLHSDEDDTPYDVDGVMYCGRCHEWVGKPLAPEATKEKSVFGSGMSGYVRVPAPEATTDEVQKSDETIFDSVKKWAAPGEAVGRETKSEGGGMEYAGAPDMRLEGGDTSKDSPVAGSNPAPPTNFEAVGRETGDADESRRFAESAYALLKLGDHAQLPNTFVAVLAELHRGSLSTLRRERDQREEDFTKWKENRKSREDTLAKAINRIKPNEYIGGFIHECAIDLLAKLESQVRELTGGMKAQDEREAKAGELCGVSRELHGCDWPDAVAERVRELTAQRDDALFKMNWADAANETWTNHCAQQADQVAELRAAVEKLGGKR